MSSGQVSPQPAPPDTKAAESLRKAADIFDNAPTQPGGPPVRLVDEAVTIFSPQDIQDLVRAKAHELRQLAALCSMAARRIQEMEHWSQDGVPEAGILAEIKAVCDFLHDRFLRASS